jgi:hypothetical protein
MIQYQYDYNLLHNDELIDYLEIMIFQLNYLKIFLFDNKKTITLNTSFLTLCFLQ